MLHAYCAIGYTNESSILNDQNGEITPPFHERRPFMLSLMTLVYLHCYTSYTQVDKNYAKIIEHPVAPEFLLLKES